MHSLFRSILSLLFFFVGYPFLHDLAAEDLSIPISGNIITEGKLGLDDIKPMIEQLFEKHIEKHYMTPDMALKAHEKFLEFFDPDRIFLLESEIFEHCSSSKKMIYMKEWNENIYSSFRNMVDTLQKAIHRAQAFRKLVFSTLDLKEIQSIEDRRPISYQTWATTLTEIEKRQHHFLYNQIIHRISLCDSQEIERVIADFDLDLSNRENEFFFLQPKKNCLEENTLLSPDERESFFAEKIMKAYGAIFDPHSAVLSVQESTQLKEKLSKEIYGSGIIGSIQNEKEFIVERIDPESPAVKSIIAQGDSILTINKRGVEDLIRCREEISFILQGDETLPQIQLTVQKKISGKIYTIILQKERYFSQDGRLIVHKVLRPEGIVYILKLDSFYASPDGAFSSELDMRDAFERIHREISESNNRPLLGIILDLRDNQGGYLLQAVKVSGLFITSGVIVSARYADGTYKLFRDIDSQQIYNGPCIVLTSKVTASAAEIVAGAMKDYGIALIVGDEKTYGKGSIQAQTATARDEALNRPSLEKKFKITIGQYYAVGGESIQKEGVESDIIVPSIWRNQKVGEEFLDATLIQGIPIEEQFYDQLKDVDEGSKKWMEEKYLPFLQKKSSILQQYLPELRKKSRNRIDTDVRWRAFISGNISSLEKIMRVGGELKMPFSEEISDMQVKEAVAIMSDLAQISHNKASLNCIK